MASLFFLALACAAAGSAQAVVGLWAAAALALLAIFRLGQPAPAATWLAAAAVGFAALIAANTLLASPAYTPAGLFHPLLFVLAFAAVRRFAAREQRRLFGGALAAALVLGVWGLVQLRVSGEARAQAFLETPSTYAALLDLVLLPAAVWLLWGRAGRTFAVLLALLCAASLAALSRGAWLGAFAGAGAAAALGAQLPRPGARAWARLGAAMILGALVSLAVRVPLPGFAHDEEAVRDAPARLESSVSRLELYAVSWESYRAHPAAGTGYLTFRYALERHRAELPSYGTENVTYFVHDDYLQLLQETGPLGLLALAALALLPYGFARRALNRLGPEQKVHAVAAVAGLASMSVHALVDFPFYVPACLLLFGSLLGALDRLLAEAGVGRLPAMPAMPALPRAVRVALLLVAAFGLAQPVAAEGSAYWGRRQLGAGRTLAAAYWFQVASRLQPRDWRYHWYLGQFWQGQAFAGGGSDAVRFALREFDAGLAANPLEVRDLLGRISTYRLLGPQLARPAGAAELDAWSREALAMAPLMPQARRERARVLEHIGRAQTAGGAR